jgi:methylglyoxal synthase
MKAAPLPTQKRIALVAHDGRKDDLLEWVQYNRATLAQHFLYGTGTTGKIIAENTGLPVKRLISGPLGGDQQIGALIAERNIDILIFFWDPLEQQPHDPDVKALLRIAVVYNIPTASNRSTADFLISSPLMADVYRRMLPDYQRRLREAYEEDDD